MKKELSHFLQFVLIVLLTGCGLFGFSLLLGRTRLAFWGAYSEVFRNWIATFLVLSAIRLLPPSLSRLGITENLPGEDKSIKSEALITIHYLFIAAASIMLSFYVPFLFVESHISLNMKEMWLSLKDTFIYWFVIFATLSFIRLGVIYVRNGQTNPNRS